jgi:hypothetical protein
LSARPKGEQGGNLMQEIAEKSRARETIPGRGPRKTRPLLRILLVFTGWNPSGGLGGGISFIFFEENDALNFFTSLSQLHDFLNILSIEIFITSISHNS